MSKYNPKADKRWNDRNREHRRYLNSRTAARTFVRHYATPEDMEELKKIYREENKNSLKKL